MRRLSSVAISTLSSLCRSGGNHCTYLRQSSLGGVIPGLLSFPATPIAPPQTSLQHFDTRFFGSSVEVAFVPRFTQSTFPALGRASTSSWERKVGRGIELGVRKYSWMSSSSSSSSSASSKVLGTKSGACFNSSSPSVITLGGVTGRIIVREATMSTKSDKLKIVIFYGSTRTGRMLDRVATFVKEEVQAKGMEAIIMDPKELPFEVLNVPLHFYPPDKPELRPEWLVEMNNTVVNADGFIIVMSEYNAGVPPALKNMLDHLSPFSYRHRPLGLVTYSMGHMGGIRAQMVFGPTALDFGMVTVPNKVTISTVHTSFSAEGKCLEDRYAKQLEKLLDDLDWYAHALKNHKAVRTPLPGSY